MKGVLLEDPAFVITRGVSLLSRRTRLPLAPQEMEYLLGAESLTRQFAYSIQARVSMFNVKFGCKRMTRYRLIKLYKEHKVKRYKLRYMVKLSEKKLDEQAQTLLDVLPQVIEIVENGGNIIFADEAMFTSRLKRDCVWTNKDIAPPELVKSKLSFQAVAAIAGTNVAGDVVAVKTCAKYIDEKVFIEFLRALGD